MASPKCTPALDYIDRELARVLLVDENPTTRLTLQTLLQAGGYGVDTAATAAEAMGKLDDEQYSLVLSDLALESPEAGLRVMAHAHMMDYRPATALLTTWQQDWAKGSKPGNFVLIEPENVPELLSQVADMISARASRRVSRELRHRN